MRHDAAMRAKHARACHLHCLTVTSPICLRLLGTPTLQTTGSSSGSVSMVQPMPQLLPPLVLLPARPMLLLSRALQSTSPALLQSARHQRRRQQLHPCRSVLIPTTSLSRRRSGYSSSACAGTSARSTTSAGVRTQRVRAQTSTRHSHADEAPCQLTVAHTSHTPSLTSLSFCLRLCVLQSC